MGEQSEFELIYQNAFTSERKMMSVVVRDRVSGKVYVFVKGAESQIMNRLSPESMHNELTTRVHSEVYRFGSLGLRTLVFAMREMTDEECNSIDWTDSQKADLIAPDYERNLTVIGCTGVEDELQDNVAECIRDFREAGIKVWMLTGDLGHTAQEIGFNCGVMSRDETLNELFKLESVE